MKQLLLILLALTCAPALGMDQKPASITVSCLMNTRFREQPTKLFLSTGPEKFAANVYGLPLHKGEGKGQLDKGWGRYGSIVSGEGQDNKFFHTYLELATGDPRAPLVGKSVDLPLVHSGPQQTPTLLVDIVQKEDGTLLVNPPYHLNVFCRMRDVTRPLQVSLSKKDDVLPAYARFLGGFHGDDSAQKIAKLHPYNVDAQGPVCVEWSLGNADYFSPEDCGRLDRKSRRFHTFLTLLTLTDSEPVLQAPAVLPYDVVHGKDHVAVTLCLAEHDGKFVVEQPNSKLPR